MEGLRTLIVEDNLLLAKDIASQIEQIGHRPIGIATSYAEADVILKQQTVDMALLDIRLEGKKDGVQLAARIRREMDIPIIIITAQSDDETIARLMPLNPEGILIKPFGYRDVYATVSIGVSRFFGSSGKSENEVLIQDGGSILRLNPAHVRLVESNRNYADLHCLEERLTVRETLKNLEAALVPFGFMKINRTTLVNRTFVRGYQSGHIVLDDRKLKVSHTLRDAVRDWLRV